METEALRLFVAVARRGSFAAVARMRGADPSAVSRAIALLEGDLGVRLFQRSTRRMALTEAGARYLARVVPLLDDLDQARDDVAAAEAEVGGTLRLTASITYGHTRVVPLLPALHAAYPRLRLELLMTDTRLDLVAEGVDLAVRLAATVDNDLIGARLFEVRDVVCAAPAWLSAHAAPRTPADLGAVSCLLFKADAFRSRWRFRDSAGAATEVAVNGHLAASNLLTVRDCALAGMGPALLPHWLVAPDIAGGRLVNLFPTHDVRANDTVTTAWLLYPSRAYLANRVRAVVDFLLPRLR